MSILKRVKINIFFKFVGEIFSRLIAVLFFIYAARKLGDVNFGKFSFAQSFSALFLIVMDLGLNTLLVRNVARDKTVALEYISNITTIKLFLAIIAFLLTILIINMLGYNKGMLDLVILMSFVTIGVAFLEYSSAIFSSLEKMNYEAILKISSKALIVLFGAGALFLGFGLKMFVGFMGLGYFLTIVLGLLLIGIKVIPISLNADLKLWKNLLKSALPLALTTVFVIIYFRLDIVLLSLYQRTDSEIGWYSASVKLIDTLGALPFLVMGGIFPIFSDLAKNFREKLEKIYLKLFQYLLILGIPIAFGTTALAKKIILGIYGNDFTGSIVSLKILIWAVVFIFINYLLINLLIALDKQKVNVLGSGLAIVVNIILNIILIPKYGYLAASAVTVVTELFLFLIYFRYVSKYFLKISLLKISWKPLLAGILMFFCLTKIQGGNLFLLIPAGMIIYLTTLCILKAFSKADIDIFKEIIRIGSYRVEK